MLVSQCEKDADARGPAGSATPSPALRYGVHALGAVACLGYLVMAILSYTQAAGLWRTVQAPRAQAFFDGLAESLRQTAPALAEWLAAGRWPADNVQLIAVHCATLAVPTLACAGVLGLIATFKAEANRETVRAARRWAFAFAAVCVFAYPVFTQDFWLSALWGRMIADGANPYHQVFTEADLRNLPLDHFPMPMSYGPLWGILSAAVMVVSGGNLFVTAALFKLILLAAWCGCIWCVGRIGENAQAGNQALAMAVLGWAPAGVVQTVAEGHNDVAMAALSIGWLMLIVRKHWAAPMALVASALCKYVSLPLALVELIVLWRMESSLRARLLRLVGPAMLGLTIMALFYRSIGFFDGLIVINDWHFLRPREAIDGLGDLIGIPLSYVATASCLVFPVVAARQLMIGYREPTIDNLITLSIAVMAAVLFGIIGHIWPWYLIWALVLAALKPSWWVSRFIIAVALVVPFTIFSWWIEAPDQQRELIALGMYAFAAACAAAPTIRQSLSGASVLKRSADAKNHI